MVPLANGLAQSIAPGIDLAAQSAALGGLEAFEALDEARIEDTGAPVLLADAVVSSGDFVIDPEAGWRDVALSGEAEIGGQLVTPTIRNPGSREHPLSVGSIETENFETGEKKLLFVGTKGLEAGFQASIGIAQTVMPGARAWPPHAPARHDLEFLPPECDRRPV